MPCYLFTYHSYASWLPDRKQGYVKRREGILEADPDEGALYRKLMVKGSISRALNQKFEKRTWLAEGGSRKRVVDQKHFDYLKNKYLPNHRGWKWSPETELFR